MILKKLTLPPFNYLSNKAQNKYINVGAEIIITFLFKNVNYVIYN
jgi:hypothetical protein